MTARAGIVVTGTEVLTGRVADRNGGWLAEQLRVAGVDVGHIVVVGDRPDQLHAALEFLAGSGVDVILTTGGLGPTADDLTGEVVAHFQRRPLAPDPALEQRIAGVVERLRAARGWRMDPAATAAATHKQAMVPAGAAVLEPVGTAPGLVVPDGGGAGHPPVVVLPGPPYELQGMWPAALADPTVAAALAGAQELRQRTLRLWGTPESELAATLRDLGPVLDDLEITTCLRDGGELEIVTRFHPDAQRAYDQLSARIADDYARTIFSTDGSSIDELVAKLLLDKGLTIATAESCTAGLLAGRLTDLAGSSAYVRGGLVVYSNEAKAELAGVEPALIARVGAVSPEVAAALAAGARARLGADLGIGVTGIAGPGGGTPDKPVGLVHVCLDGPSGPSPLKLNLPGSRALVRARTVSTALHLVRRYVSAL